MKFYRDLFESSLNRVFPDNEKRRFSRRSTTLSCICHLRRKHILPVCRIRKASKPCLKFLRHAGGRWRPDCAGFS